MTDVTYINKKEATPYPVNRRNFLKVLSGGSALIALGGFVRLFDFYKGNGPFLRPPGSLSESDFRARCLKCGICEEICPQQVIQPVNMDESLEVAGTPTLSFSQNYCSLCMQCTQVCPTGALYPIAQSEVLIGIARIIPDRCAAWNGGNCDHCATQCPFRAIQKDEQNRPYVVEELCVGCGICEWTCRLTAKMGFTKGIIVFPINA